MTYEALLIKALSDTHVWPIITAAVDSFTARTYCQPELIKIASSLRVAVIKELINNADMQAIDAIAEPLWVDGIPLIFSKDLGEHFVVLTNRQINKELRI